MEYIVTIHELTDIFKLNHASSILIGHDDFAIRLTRSFNRNEIKKAKNICKKLDKKLYILVNKIFNDGELNKLKDYLNYLKSVDINGIFFSDMAVFMIAKELGLQDKCFYYHETLLRNTHDLLSYKQIGINKMIITKDMGLDEILNLPSNLKDNVGLMVQGYFPIYYSKRKSLKNHLNRYHLDKSLKDSKNLYLKEKTRDELYPFIENKNGMVLFFHQPLSYYEYIDKIKDKISFIIIDGILEDFYMVNKWLKAYYNKIEFNKTIDEDFLKFSTGFLLKKVGVK